MDTLFTHVLNQFRLDSPALSCEPHGCGHINKTYVVDTRSGSRYLLQKIGPAFKNVDILQENISAVVNHLPIWVSVRKPLPSAKPSCWTLTT